MKELSLLRWSKLWTGMNTRDLRQITLLSISSWAIQCLEQGMGIIKLFLFVLLNSLVAGVPGTEAVEMAPSFPDHQCKVGWNGKLVQTD